MKVKDLLNPMLEPGIHKLVLAEIKDEQTTAAGDPMIGLRWKAEDAVGQVWDNIAVSDAAAWKIGQLFIALGGDPEFEFDDVVVLGDELLNMLNVDDTEVYADTGTDTYTVTRGENKGQERTKATIIEYKTAETGKALIGAGPKKEVPF